MTNMNQDDQLSGPFKNGRLTEPEEDGTTRPNRVNRSASPEPIPGEPDSGDQTRAIPVHRRVRTRQHPARAPNRGAQ